MSDFKVNVDFDRLKEYFSNYTTEQMALLKSQGGVTLDFEFEYYDEVYQKHYDGLSIILDRYNLIDHINELYYIIITLDNNYQEISYAQEERYKDDKTAKEVAQFILAFKSAKSNQAFELVAKSVTDTAAIKNPEVAKWMTQLIVDAIETLKFPVTMFGESIYRHLFDSDLVNQKNIPIERLENTSRMKIKKPKHSDSLFRFILHIRTYLNDYTDLKTPDSTVLGNMHANLFFDIFELLGYMHRNQIDSEPKDYIHAIFRNKLKLLTSL